MLIKKGANVNARAKDGALPLNFAIAHKDTELHNVLKGKGANLADFPS